MNTRKLAEEILEQCQTSYENGTTVEFYGGLDYEANVQPYDKEYLLIQIELQTVKFMTTYLKDITG